MWSYEEDKVETARELLREASAADPAFAPAYAYYAYSCYITVIMGYARDPEARLEEGMEAARKALQCDDKDAISYFAIGRIHMMQGRHDESVAALRKSIELNPSFAQAYHGLGFALALAGELEESKRCMHKAISISPRDPMTWAFTVVHALTLLLNREFEECLQWCYRTAQNPRAKGYWAHAMMASALAHLDRTDEAKVALARALEAKPDLSIAFLKSNMPTKQPKGIEPYLDGLRAAGLS